MAHSPIERSPAVYLLSPAETKYCAFATKDGADVTIYERFNGQPMATDWQPVAITAADEDDETALLADHTLLGVVPVFTVRAVEVLLDFLRPNGELLPLRYGRAEYMAYNVTRVVDAPDESRSKLTRFQSSGRIQSIQEYVFWPERVVGLSIFKIPQLIKAFVFVTDPFVERVKSARLTGFEFRKVWTAQELDRET
jgi:hypothetical protein